MRFEAAATPAETAPCADCTAMPRSMSDRLTPTRTLLLPTTIASGTSAHGISVHDVGGIGGDALTRPLPAGVVFNVEPIIAFDDKKIHIRLEDTVLLTEQGAENLTAGVPAEVDQVYGLVKERGVNSAGVAAEGR